MASSKDTLRRLRVNLGALTSVSLSSLGQSLSEVFVAVVADPFSWR